MSSKHGVQASFSRRQSRPNSSSSSTSSSTTPCREITPVPPGNVTLFKHVVEMVEGQVEKEHGHEHRPEVCTRHRLTPGHPISNERPSWTRPTRLHLPTHLVLLPQPPAHSLHLHLPRAEHAHVPRDSLTLTQTLTLTLTLALTLEP